MKATLTISHDTLTVNIDSARGSWLRHRMMDLRSALTSETPVAKATYTKREFGHRTATQSFVRTSGRPGVLGSAGRAVKFLRAKGFEVEVVAA